MSNRLKITGWILLASSLALPVLGDPTVVDRPTITTEGAKALIAKTEARARSLGRTVNIAVVDSGGNVLAIRRNGWRLSGRSRSLWEQTPSALRFEESTARIESSIHDGRYPLLTTALSR